MTRPEAATRIAALGAGLVTADGAPTFAGLQLVDVGHALATGSAAVRANVTRKLARVAGLLRVESGVGANEYGMAAELAAEVVR